MIIDEIREKIKFQKNILIVGNDSGKLKEIYNKVLKPVERVINRNEYLRLIDEIISKENGIFNLRKEMAEKIYFTFKKEFLRDMHDLKIDEFELKEIACKSAFEFSKLLIPFHNVLTTFIDIKNNDNN